MLRSEADNNDQRINSCQDLLNQKEEAIARTIHQISDSHAQIQDLKYNLNKLDGELGYFEN